MGKSKDLATGAAYQDQTESDTRYVNATGDNMINDGEVLKLSRTSGQSENLIFSTQAASGISGTTYVGQVESAGNNALEVFTTGAIPVHIGTNNAVRMTVDGSGRVTLPSQPQFIFQGSYNNWTTINQSGQWLPFTGSSAVATSTNNELAMNWTSSRSGGYNPSGNGINATTGVYTAPVTGTYLFYLQSYVIKQDSGGEYYHINSFINGGNKDDYTIFGYNDGSNTYSTPEITKVVRLSANDTFAFRLYTNQSASFKIYPHYTCFAGYLLG